MQFIAIQEFSVRGFIKISFFRIYNIISQIWKWKTCTYYKGEFCVFVFKKLVDLIFVLWVKNTNFLH